MALSLLQVQDSVFDLLGAALVPVLGADIAAGAAEVLRHRGHDPLSQGRRGYTYTAFQACRLYTKRCSFRSAASSHGAGWIHQWKSQ